MSREEAVAAIDAMRCKCPACNGLLVWEALTDEQKKLYLVAAEVLDKDMGVL